MKIRKPDDPLNENAQSAVEKVVLIALASMQ